MSPRALSTEGAEDTLPRASAPPHRRHRRPRLEESPRPRIDSERLAGQALLALGELVRGLTPASDVAAAAPLDEGAHRELDHLYGGLCAVLLRLMFLSFAEERGLSSWPASHIAVRDLFDELRCEAARCPEALDQRHGAWTRVLGLFRAVHDATRGDATRSRRHERLFDPERWPFLEGDRPRSHRTRGGAEVLSLSDGALLRVLERLLVLDGARLSYGALEVELLGSIHEHLTGFRLARATETSIALGRAHALVGLDTLLAREGPERERLVAAAGVALTGDERGALRRASDVDDLVTALGRRLSPLTPRPVPAGGLCLVPTDLRRRSGSHYTPRALSEPVVRAALRPLLDELEGQTSGARPTPEQLLALRICDPAMGSGAFLLEACRQLGDELVKAYEVHGPPSDLSQGDDLLDHARREVARRCLYGVDKDPLAVELGKLSLWLVTRAKGDSLGALDHALRHGDSLVGLTRAQLMGLHWAPARPIPEVCELVRPTLETSLRPAHDADAARDDVRALGDAVVASFFSEETPKAREAARARLEREVLASCGAPRRPRGACAEPSVPTFHWQVELPEIFSSGRGGFDAIVGNPPFLGGKRISTSHGRAYADWLTAAFPGSNGNADLVAFFFRRAYELLASGGTLGLVATKTIAEGDTRAAGLRWLRAHGATLYDVQRRVRWPGEAAVLVSTIALRKGVAPRRVELDGRPVETITSFLFHRGGDDEPARLRGENERAFIGCFLRGMGFTFDDATDDATPLAELERLSRSVPHLERVVRPYLGGEEVLHHPEHRPHRHAICLADLTEAEARSAWPELMSILERKVKPARARLGRSAIDQLHRERWWRFANDRPELRAASRGLGRILAIPRVSTHLCAVFLPTSYLLSDQLVALAFSSYAMFTIVQSRAHEAWARFFSSTMGEGLRYAPSDCFETFPLPAPWDTARLCEVGAAYYAARAAHMAEAREGLTKTYHRFHDPDEGGPAVLALRELHAAMDRAVLEAYGWSDLEPTCQFLTDGEVDLRGPASDRRRTNVRKGMGRERRLDPDGDTDGDTDGDPDGDADSSGARRTKRPTRYRWPDDVRDEVLARLLELNARRAREQAGERP